MRIRFPAITAATVCACLIVFFTPGLGDFLVFDRQLILDGEVWRVVTAPFVHFSASHLVWNLLVFAAAGCVIERGGHRRFGSVCVLSIISPGILFLVTKPDLSRYGGLSGVVVGATAYLCLCRIRRAGGDRAIWMAIFALLIAKIVVESVIGASIFASADAVPFRVLPSAHALGVAAAVTVFVPGARGRKGRDAGKAPSGLSRRGAEG